MQQSKPRVWRWMAVATATGAAVVWALFPKMSLGTPRHRASTPTAPASPSLPAATQQSSFQLDLGPADAQYDLRFMDAMTLRHQGAIEMAREAVRKARRMELRLLSQDIIVERQREIGQMRTWRRAWYPNVGVQPVIYSTSTGHIMPMSQEQQASIMLAPTLGPANSEFDRRFFDAMIVYQQGAIDLAKDALKKSQRPEIQKLAQSIVNTEQQAIETMQIWRQRWYGQ